MNYIISPYYGENTFSPVEHSFNCTFTQYSGLKFGILLSSCQEILNSSGGSRPGHKVSGTQSEFPNLNENGQKYHFCEVFLTQNPVNILSRSATEEGGKSVVISSAVTNDKAA